MYRGFQEIVIKEDHAADKPFQLFMKVGVHEHFLGGHRTKDAAEHDKEKRLSTMKKKPSSAGTQDDELKGRKPSVIWKGNHGQGFSLIEAAVEKQRRNQTKREYVWREQLMTGSKDSYVLVGWK